MTGADAMRRLALRTAHDTALTLEPRLTSLEAKLDLRLANLEDHLADLAGALAEPRRSPRPAPVLEQLRPRLLAALTPTAQPAAALERALNRPPKDRTLRRALAELSDYGLAEHTADGWRRTET